MKFFKFCIAALFFWLPMAGQVGASPQQVVTNDSSLYFKYGINKSFRVDYISPKIFRFRIYDGDSCPEGGLVKYGMVNNRYHGHEVKEVINNKTIELYTEHLKLVINRQNGQIALYDTAGNLLTKNDKPPTSNHETGFRLCFQLDKGERVYGTGDVSREQIQKRGHSYQMHVKNVKAYIPIPFIVSDMNWGLFMNTTMIHDFDIGETNNDRLTVSGNKGVLDFYLIKADSMLDVLDNYTAITGKPHLLPKWGYGLIWVGFIYDLRSRDVLYEALKFRDRGIPCDVFGLEPGWMGKNYDYSTQKEWSKERHPMITEEWIRKSWESTFVGTLNKMGFKLSLWLCTHYDFSAYEEIQLLLRDKNASVEDIIGRPGYELDGISSIANVEPWFEHLKKFVDDGARMFKLDGSDQVTLKITPGNRWANGMEDFEMINLYPMLYNKQMSLGYKEYTGKRSLIFTAGGYAGIQQYSATWAGDTGGGKTTMPSLLNHGLSGHSNVCTDMDNMSKEGIHFGFFQTLSQVNGWARFKQPWFLGKELEAVFTDYARLRYKLIPYIYTMAHLASERAVPVMRAMPLMYPDDRNCDNYMNQYMFGDAFLVSAFTDTVYLPEGEWIDYWTGNRVQGGKEVRAEFPDNKGGTLFVKAGSIIPTQEVRDYIDTYTPENINWEIFPKGNTRFTLYEDDGESYNYLKGEVAKSLIECMESSDHITITIHPREGKYNGMPESRTHSLTINYPNKKMHLKEKDVKWRYDEETQSLYIDSIREKPDGIVLTIYVE